MATYAAYLEIAGDGRCLAHVLDLPGLVVRADTPDEALDQLPDAIASHLSWLRRHGEPAPPTGEPIEIEVAGESTGFGPFERRSAAALFPPDREPVSAEEMERTFRLMAHSRADLMALVQHLPSSLLDWKPDRESFSLRELLRHVGDAEEWYVSRIVPPESLPPEWQVDRDLPVFEFLDMERRTAVGRLRQLSGEERSILYLPRGWSEQPQEPWTVRKVLRRFLEHEREHTWQAREILAARRRHLLANLAAERAGLLETCLGLDQATLCQVPVVGDWTIKEILAHIAAWDSWQHGTLMSLAAGQDPDLSATEDFDASNSAFLAERADRSLDEILSELQSARDGWVAWLESLPPEVFFQARSIGGHDWSFFAGPVADIWQHDAEHARDIAGWRKTQGIKAVAGPKSCLLAALDAARDELETAAALVPANDRSSLPVCGHWTLKDLLGHIADWEQVGAEGMSHMVAGHAPQVERIKRIDAWNRAHIRAHQGDSWEEIWEHFCQTRQALRSLVDRMNDADLAQPFPMPWVRPGSAYGWVSIFVVHDREHAGDLRSACLNLP